MSIKVSFSGTFYFWKGDGIMENGELKRKLQEAGKDGRISCTAARKLAGECGVPVKEIGKLCDELKIKIHSCELGCF